MGQMTRVHTITRRRRTYNQWVANETLEDFALRFTARRARRWSPMRVANTALGSISFLALEAIGAALTISYGFDNAVAAMMIVGALLFLTALPISYHAAKSGVDIDLLTRGAGFGYIGSTITSLIYASFTFIFFALEAAILSLALEYCFGVPLFIGYLLNALVVIPLVTHGFTKISFFQKWTQAVWIVLQVAPFVCVALFGDFSLREWAAYTPEGDKGGLDLLMLGAASGVVFSLIAQIGEQVDFLRFLPEPKTARERRRWWAALIAAGPGWSVLGVAKMLAGSYLAVLALSAGASAVDAADPTHMYLAAFQTAIADPRVAVVIVGVFVVVSQLKINVTNAYAGSIAWSNFFSRLTHAHPGRVVWLVFNVLIALALMQLGVFAALEATLTHLRHRRGGLGRRHRGGPHRQQAARPQPQGDRVPQRAPLRHQPRRLRRNGRLRRRRLRGTRRSLRRHRGCVRDAHRVRHRLRARPSHRCGHPRALLHRKARRACGYRRGRMHRLR